jgi:transcription elongation factor GreA
MLTVSIGSHVTIADQERRREREFQIVSGQGDPAQGTLSVASPVARALAGHTVGDVVAVTAPAGERHLRIVALSA